MMQNLNRNFCFEMIEIGVSSHDKKGKSDISYRDRKQLTKMSFSTRNKSDLREVFRHY